MTVPYFYVSIKSNRRKLIVEKKRNCHLERNRVKSKDLFMSQKFIVSSCLRR